MSLRGDLEKLENNSWSNGGVFFKPIKTEEDLIYAAYDCRLNDEQKEMVNPAWFSIGRAYLFREDNYPCIIYNQNDGRIGFINFCKWLGEGDAYSWSFFIDKDHQKKGYGKKSAELAVRILKTANSDIQIKLAAERNNTKAHQLYRSLGFCELHEFDGDDLVFGI